MHFISTISATHILALLANGEYISTCGRPALNWHDDLPYLTSICAGKDGHSECVELDITQCYENRLGELRGAKK